MKKIYKFRGKFVAILMLLNVILVSMILNRNFQVWFIEPGNKIRDVFWYFIPLNLFFILISFDAGGKYVLYFYLFAFSYLISATVGWTAGSQGEWAVVETAIIICGSSFIVLVICIVILYKKRKCMKNQETQREIGME